jgi:hypothetical protein
MPTSAAANTTDAAMRLAVHPFVRAIGSLPFG